MQERRQELWEDVAGDGVGGPCVRAYVLSCLAPCFSQFLVRATHQLVLVAPGVEPSAYVAQHVGHSPGPHQVSIDKLIALSLSLFRFFE